MTDDRRDQEIRDLRKQIEELHERDREREMALREQKALHQLDFLRWTNRALTSLVAFLVPIMLGLLAYIADKIWSLGGK